MLAKKLSRKVVSGKKFQDYESNSIPSGIESNNSLRLAYISPKFPCTSLVFEQAELVGLLENGLEVLLLSCRDSRDSGEILHEFAKPLASKCFYLSVKGFFTGLSAAARFSPRQLFKITALTVKACMATPQRIRINIAALALAICFFPLARERKINAIHADFGQGSATVAWYLAILLGVPFSFKVHAFDIFSHSKSKCDVRSFFLSKAKAASAIFSAHEYGLRELKARYPEISTKISVHRVVSAPVLRGRSPISEENSREDSEKPAKESFRISALGRLEAKKGFHVLVAAIALLKSSIPDLHCDIWGTGAEYSNLRKLIVSLGLEELVCLRGIYRQEDLDSILAGSNAVILPCLNAGEGELDGMPTVILEAMSLGYPVIASDIAGIPEIISSGRNGLLVEPENPNSLATAVLGLYQNKALRDEITARARTESEVLNNHLASASTLLECWMTAFRSKNPQSDRK